MTAETAVRKIIATIDAAWKAKQFDGLEACFHEKAVIVGPGFVEFAAGRDKCAESYREFANNAAVLEYSESQHMLRVWESAAVYAFAWRMTYQRESGPKTEEGTDQLFFAFGPSGWQVIWRYIHFQTADATSAA
jgi:ketosteroid isomerase-like protein